MKFLAHVVYFIAGPQMNEHTWTPATGTFINLAVSTVGD